MVHCSVTGCKSDSRNVNEKHISFHNFPKDLNLINEWKKRCDKKNIKIKSARVCSLHFSEESYSLRDRLLPKNKYRKLCNTAIPSLLLPVINNNEDCRSKRAEVRNRKKIINEIFSKTKYVDFIICK